MLAFKYSGRNAKTVQNFLAIRPDFKNYYIYDVLLAGGELLYSCKGGIGVTKEKYVVAMHKFLSMPLAPQLIKEKLETDLRGGKLIHRYESAVKKFNSRRINKLQSLNDHALLYCLWLCSNFEHKYTQTGYSGRFLPRNLDLEYLKTLQQTSKNKSLFFREEDFFTLSESIISPQVVVYAHLPDSFTTYGCGFTWNAKKLNNLARVLNEFSSLGHKVCISAYHKKADALKLDYSSLFPNFSHLLVNQFKEQRYSEIFFLNF